MHLTFYFIREVEKEVNLWVSETTNGLIKDLLPHGSLSDTTMLVLANALYFKGEWNDKFDSLKTRDGEFYLFNGSTVQIPFMTSQKKQLISSLGGDFKSSNFPTNKFRKEGNWPCISSFPTRGRG